MSAYGAFEIGLVNEVLPAVSLMDRTWELAQQIANNSALSIRLMKRGMALAAEGASLDQLMEYEVDACLQAVGTEERREKLKQFHARK